VHLIVGGCDYTNGHLQEMHLCINRPHDFFENPRGRCAVMRIADLLDEYPFYRDQIFIYRLWEHNGVEHTAPMILDFVHRRIFMLCGLLE
jgi:hypothetical protein